MLNWDLSDEESGSVSAGRKTEAVPATKPRKQENLATRKEKQKTGKVKKAETQPAQNADESPKKRKAKFVIGGASTEPEVTNKNVKVVDPDEEANETADGDAALEKKKRKSVSENKRKSLKYKQRKKKKKMDSLRSTMPKEKLEEYLSSQQSSESAQMAALNYLRLWNSARNAWKFKKNRQTWLLQHIFDTKAINEKDFEILIKYIEPMKGLASEETKKRATEIMELNSNKDDATSKIMVTRATCVLQILD